MTPFIPGETAPLENLIPMGEHAQMQVEGAKYSTIFRGVAPPRWIFLDIPQSGGKLITLVKQQPVRMRYVSHGVAYGFRSKISGAYVTPHQILVIEFPREIESRNLRRSERIRTLLPARLALPGHGEVDATMLDLSREGALFSIEAPHPPKTGEPLRAWFTLPGAGDIAGLACAARNHRRHGRLWLVGVEFSNLESSAAMRARGYYDALLAPGD